MKTHPRDVDTDELTRLIEREHGLVISLLSFLPEGDESYVFVAQDEDRIRHFVRLEEDMGQRDRRENAYAALETLAHGELAALVVPRRARRGGFLSAYGRYLVAVFPFIQGRTLDPTATSEDRPRVAEIVAALHESPVSDLGLPREALENPFEDPIRRALSRVGTIPDPNRYQERVSALLTAHREDVESSLRRMQNFRMEQDELVGEWVLTHGEPHLANVLKDPQGGLHLTDCGDLAVGPPERDLFAFSDVDFERSLTHYLRRRSRARLSPRLFEFYYYRWALQEIADYTTRILFRQMGPEEDEHSEKELWVYVPTRHADIARRIGEIRDVLARFPLR